MRILMIIDIIITRDTNTGTKGGGLPSQQMLLVIRHCEAHNEATLCTNSICKYTGSQRKDRRERGHKKAKNIDIQQACQDKTAERMSKSTQEDD